MRERREPLQGPPLRAAPGVRALRAFAIYLPGLQAKSETCRSKDVCNSTQNAGSSATSKRLVWVTHPFHPFSGRSFVCVGERFNRYGKRLLLQVDDGTFCAIPPHWTDQVAPDPEVVMGRQRALFRVADLLELERLVSRLSKRGSKEVSRGV